MPPDTLTPPAQHLIPNGGHNLPKHPGPPLFPALPLLPLGHPASLAHPPGPGTAGPRWLSPRRHRGHSQPWTCVSGRGGAWQSRPTRRGGPRAWGARPSPNPPLFSQGLRFQRSPWDPAPSLHPHVPRKIGSAGACLFAVAVAPACDYSCSTAGCCRALCASARLPHGAGTPPCRPQASQGAPAAPQHPWPPEPGHTSTWTPGGQGSIMGHGQLSLGCPHKAGGECMPVAGSRDRAGLTAQLGPDPNASGKFPVSSAAAQHSHALHSQPGLSPTPRLCLPSIPPAGDSLGPLARPCHRRASCQHGEPRASSHLPCLSFPSGKVSLQQDLCKLPRAKQATVLADMGHAWPAGTQCATCLAAPPSRSARLYKYPGLGSTARTAKPSPGSACGSRHHSPWLCPPLRTAPRPGTLTPDPGRDRFQP